jgi:hypothetical protein
MQNEISIIKTIEETALSNKVIIGYKNGRVEVHRIHKFKQKLILDEIKSKDGGGFFKNIF